MKQKSQLGFTIIEMVIVIVMVAIISAIAVPMLKRAYNNANEAAAIAAVRVVSQQLNSNFISRQEYLTLGRLKSEGFIDSRFGGLTSDATESQTPAYSYKLTFIDLPDNERTYIFSAIPTQTNILTRTGTRRFGVDKRGAIVFDSTNFFTHYETLEDLETGTPVGNK